MSIFGDITKAFNTLNVVTEKVDIEKEFVLFVDIIDVKEVTEKADSVVKMEQWEMKTNHHKDDGIKGTIRIRALDDEKYIFGIKEYLKSKNGPTKAKEYEKEVDREAFEIFKSLAPMGTIKKRHYFKTTDFTFEVDVFYDSKGKLVSNWAKIDVEINTSSHIQFEMDHLPFKVAEIIQHPRTKEEDLRVKKIFDSILNQYNENNILPIDTGKGK